jgi:ABC-type lipoprotein release transport system permease subunit
MFKMMIKMAFFNVWRRLNRSLMVILMIGMSLSGLIFFQGLYDGMVKEMIESATEADSGDMSIYHDKYRLSKSLDDTIVGVEKQYELVSSDPNVKSAVKRLHTEGLVASASFSQGAMIIGGDLDAENLHSSLKEELISGEYSFGKKERGVILGKVLAKKLKISVGKKVILTSQDINGEISSLAFRVKGIVYTNSLAVDRAALISFDKANQLIGTSDSDSRATQIALLLHDSSKGVTFEVEASNKLYSWEELYPQLLKMREMIDAFNMVSYAIVFIVAAIGIFGVILVSVLERLREFGVLMAIGTPFRYVAIMLFLESFVLALFGFILGSVIAGSSLYYFSGSGIDLSTYSGAMEQFNMRAILIPTFKGEFFIDAFVAVMMATLLAIIVPLRKLRKLNPVEAINTD